MHIRLFVCCAAIFVIGMGQAQAQTVDRGGLITVTDHENGALRSEVLLPCGQAYVELFQRHNGVQVTARDIAASAQPAGGGYCVYSAITTGFDRNDAIQTRFYSYLPGAPGVFTPGPSETVWNAYAVGGNPIGARPGNVQPGDLLVTDAGNGDAHLDLFAPSGQAYVEVFAREDGVQNVAGGITETETPIGNGFSRYRRTVDSVGGGALLEVRAYNFLPDTAGVFFPGASPHVWREVTYAGHGQAGAAFVGSDASWQLGATADGEIAVYFGHATSHIVRAQTGWYLDRARVPTLTVPLRGFDDARLGEVYVRRCDTGAWEAASALPAFAPGGAAERVGEGLYQFAPFPFASQLPGTRVNPAYECGGTDITIQTLIGPQTLKTGAVVHYAYVVVHGAP